MPTKIAAAAPSSADDDSPDARLAARIARRLVADRLIAPADEAAVRDGLAAGRLSKVEWRGWAEGDGPGHG